MAFFDGWSERGVKIFYALLDSVGGADEAMPNAGPGLIDAGWLLGITLCTRAVLDGKVDISLSS